MGRGQVSLFVIIGLALLVLIALFLLFTRDATVLAGRIDSQEAITFTERCLQATAEDAFLLAGRQGGLTRLEGRSFSEAQPWVGDTFMSGPQRVPYWYHTVACENPYGCVTFAPPPLCRAEECVFDGQYAGAGVSIQEEVEAYIEDNLGECLEGFSPVISSYSFRADDPRVQVTFRPDDIDVRLFMPVTLRDDSGETVNLDQFSTRLDIDFEELYRLARDIVALEYTTNFAEENFLHFLSVYQGDPPLLPPFNDASFFGGNKMWLRSEAQQRIEDEVMPYLSFMQVVNAQAGYAPIMQTGVADDEYGMYARGLFAYAELQLVNRSYPNHAVSFLYPYSPIYLNINDKEVLKGDDLSGGNFLMKIVGVFIKKYEHKYDVAFPLLTIIEDDDALGGKGYALTFGIEANIVNNFPYYANRTINTIDTRTYSVLDQHEPQHRVDNEVTVRVKNAWTGDAVREAMVVYECGWRFELGQTDSQGTWTGSLPFCLGGALRAEKGADYYPAATPFDSEKPGAYTLDLAMWPYQKKEIVVYKRTAAHVEAYEDPVVPGCNPLTSCREELDWGGVQELSRLMINGTTVQNESEQCSGVGLWENFSCSPETELIKDDQYALVMINRLPDPDALVTDQSPLTSTLTFGDDDGDPVIQTQIDIEFLTELHAAGNLTDEEYTALTKQTQEADFAINLSRKQTVSLIPGRYTLDGMLFYNGGLVIPEERRKVGPFWDKKTIILPEQEFPTWLQGGVQFSDQNLIEFTPEQIYGSDPLVIYVLEQELPTSWSDLENNYQSIEEYQKGRETLALPRFE